MFGNVGSRFGSTVSTSGLSVFAVDPGETTGWAWGLVSVKELGLIISGGMEWGTLFSRLMASERFECGELSVYRGPLSASSLAAQLAMQEAKAAREIACEIVRLGSVSSLVSKGRVSQITDVVSEDFILRERTKARNLLSPCRLQAGIMQEIIGMREQIGVSVQSPSDAKSVVTDERLKALGLWQVGQQHARDACRHLALFLRKLTAD